MTYRKNYLVALIAALFTIAGVSLLILFPARSDAATTPGTAVVWGTCPNLKDWYVNEDEGDQKPTATADGLEFTGKDLIHHAVTPIDFTAFDNSTRSFTAHGDADKVVLKFETTAPYGNLVIQPDGKLWSTAVDPTSVGGQNNPVAHAADLFGADVVMKGGKARFSDASRVTTVGVGYWTETGSTVVSEIRFHGVTYSLTCKPAPSSSAPTSSAPATTKPKPSGSNPQHISPTPNPSYSGPTGALAITGPSSWVAGGLAAVLLFGGGGVLWATRRRKNRFVA